MVPFDCSALFPGYERANAAVIGNSVSIELWLNGAHTHIDMEVDKIAQFLENCRKQQDPRIYHLSEPT